MKIPEEKRFWLCDGRVLKSLKELREALRYMDNGIFTYHVNENKNDFYNWIKDVIGNEKLAEEIKGKCREDALDAISKEMKKKKKPKHIESRHWTKIEKCPFISPILECLAGGEGHAGCTHPSFHENCEIKQRVIGRQKL